MGRRYHGGSAARTDSVFNYKLPPEEINGYLKYNENISIDTLRTEYSRLRDIAQKRIQRMEGKPEAQETLEQVRNGFPTLREIRSEAGGEMDLRGILSHNIQRVSNFLTARRGSLSGIRSVNREIVSTLKKSTKTDGRGGIDIDVDELRNFGNFMNAMKEAFHFKGRRKGQGRDLASDQFARLWEMLNEKGNITEREFYKAIDRVAAELEGEENAPSLQSIAEYKNKKGHRLHASNYFAEDVLSKSARKRRRK